MTALRFADSPARRSMSLWVPVLLWAAFIFYLSSLPYLRLVQGWWDYPLRKAAHMTVYAVLARLLARAFTGSTYWSWKKVFAWSLALAILYAYTDELHQEHVPGRHPSLIDVGYDAAGAWLSLGLAP